MRDNDFLKFAMVTFFIFLNFLRQFSKFDAKGIKMIRMTKQIDLDQLYFLSQEVVPIGPLTWSWCDLCRNKI